MKNELNRLLENRIYNHEECVSKIEELADEFAIKFAKWIDKNYFQGEKSNTYAKCKEDFLNKETIFNIKQLSIIFHASVLQADE